jgi:PTH1 family peptidyl-tRNA hydrolase
MEIQKQIIIDAIIGLGNPGRQHEYQRHNIGFRIVDALVKKYGSEWRHKNLMEYAIVQKNDHSVIIIKPQTYMNLSGKVIPWLLNQGIKVQNILVVHDELEKQFGHISIRIGGSARGHNGLRSIISACGHDIMRLRFGIGRPIHKEDVASYVLQDFSESKEEVDRLIKQAVDQVSELL